MLLLLLSLVFTFIGNGNLHNEVDNYLKVKLSAYDKYEFEIVNAPHDALIKLAGDDNVKLNGSYIYLPADIVCRDNTIKKTFLTVKLKLFKNVFAAAVDIPSKAVLEKTDTIIELADITNCSGEVITADSSFKNVRSRSFIKKGTVMLEDYLEPVPDIKAGDRVTAIVRAGNVVISTNAEARQEGITGDIIRVVTKDKKMLRAKIIDSQNVIIEN